jgi:hypothetical protein
MEDPRVKAVTILDMVLIIMTGSWITFGVYRGLSTLELAYNWIYVIVTISTAILNLRLIHKK